MQAAERLAGHLAVPHYLLAPARALRVHALVRLGETERAAQDLADLGEQDRERGEMRIAAAAPLGDPGSAERAMERALDLAARSSTSPPAAPRMPLEPLRDSEIRVLRYLPTNLTAPEIASELYVSRNTVKTHMRNLYTKLGTHRRAEAVERVRALGLLAPSPRRR